MRMFRPLIGSEGRRPSPQTTHLITSASLTFAMPPIKSVVEKLKLSDGKTHWEIKPSDAEHVGDCAHLKLPRQGVHIGFTRLCQEHDGVMQVVDQGSSLVNSLGYGKIVELRNVAQAASLLEEQEKSVPEMFKGICKKKTQVFSQSRIAELKQHPDVITVEVPDIPGQPAFCFDCQAPDSGARGPRRGLRA